MKLRAFAETRAAEQDQHILLLTQDARGVADGMRVGLRHRWHRQGSRHHAAIIPGGIGRQDQGRDLTRGGARRLYGHGRIGAHLG